VVLLLLMMMVMMTTTTIKMLYIRDRQTFLEST
jgi:hypothetical protein